MKSVLSSLAFLAMALGVSPNVVAAGETTTWVGRLIDDRSVFLTMTHVEGDNWILRRNSVPHGDYELTTRTGTYSEFKAKGQSLRIRIYSDRMEVSDAPGSTYVEIAKGQWR